MLTMAALYFARTSIFNISKANIPRFTSLSLPQKTSTFGFTSASTYSQGRHASEETDNGYDGDEAIRYSDGKRSEDARNKMEEGKDRMKEGAGEMKDAPMDGMKEANEKMKQRVAEMRDRAGDMKDKTIDAAETVAEKTKQTVAGAWDAAKWTSRKIKESVVGKR